MKALRLAAYEAMQGQPPLTGFLRITLTVWAVPSDGDLDNFITGICEGLMAAHRNTPVASKDWEDLPKPAKPDCSIVFQDDGYISQIIAERKPALDTQRHYKVTIEQIEP